ncbi:protein translocase subunit SecF [Paenibacillus massiliensis]|uniref:protein translocase subunit SecF n=1 Tax=Paenibacillus massiliensis TaxID=225917 RepID=UPI000363C3DA|nr:protein translocase subunit SecF [Paenibacillus massiliensis]
MRFDWKWDYIKHSKIFIIASIVITLAGILFGSIFGLNYGVDFRSGTNMDINMTKQVSQAEIQSLLAEQGVDEEIDFRPGNERVSIRFANNLTDQQVNKIQTAFHEKLDPSAAFEVNTVDAEMAKELERNAMLAVLIACVAIAIYVSIRFEWRFAIAAIVSLLHDAILVIAVFSIFQLEIGLIFITAVLTIIGFSINDTIVVFDRIRENARFAKKKSPDSLKEIVNNSIAQTMTRTLATVFTVFVAAVCLLIFGGASIRMFSLAMTIGLLFGAYSSIFIAAPLWLALKVRQKPASTASKA